jgi:hypothetical protein
MSKVLKDIDQLILDYAGLPEYVYSTRILEAAKSEIIQLKNSESEAEYFRTLCEGYEKTSL